MTKSRQSQPEWLPIRPYLNKQDPPYFLAFDNLDNAAKYVPVFPEGGNRAPPPAEECLSFWDQGRSLDVQVAASLGIGKYLTTSASMRTGFIEYSVMYYKSIESEQGPIYGTRWGAGFRLTILYTKFKSSIEVSAGAVAAAAQIGTTSAHFEIEGYGYFYPELLTEFPLPGKFDLDTWSSFQRAIESFRARYSEGKNRKEFSPAPLWIKMAKPEPPSVITNSYVILWAANRIAQDLTLREAITEARKLGHNIGLVKSAYARIASISDLDANIRRRHRRAAKGWINV